MVRHGQTYHYKLPTWWKILFFNPSLCDTFVSLQWSDLPEDDQEAPAPPAGPIVTEDMSATESAPPAVETNLKHLDAMTPEEEAEMEDLLNMDFTKAYHEPMEEGQAPQVAEPEEVSRKF